LLHLTEKLQSHEKIGKESPFCNKAEESHTKYTNMTNETIEELLRMEHNQIVISAEDFKAIVKFCVEKNEAEEDKQRYLSRQEASEFLHCDLATLWKMEQKGTLIPTRLGRRVYYKKADLVQCLERGRR
jgi:hypothetical protein